MSNYLFQKKQKKPTGASRVTPLPDGLEGFIFSNIPSYGGGSHLWYDGPDDISFSGPDDVGSDLDATDDDDIDPSSTTSNADAAVASAVPNALAANQLRRRKRDKHAAVNAIGLSSPIATTETSSPILEPTPTPTPAETTRIASTRRAGAIVAPPTAAAGAVFAPESMQDGRLEVCGVAGALQLGRIQVWFFGCCCRC